MFKTLTWGDFYGFILPVLLVYYLFVVLKYYRHELVAAFSSKNTRPQAGVAVKEAPPMEVVKVPEVGAAQPELFQAADQGLSMPADMDGGRQSPELFKVMAAAVAALKEVVAEAVAGHLSKEDLLVHIREVLVGYEQLRNTPYEGAINSFLTRTCASNFSLVLEVADVAALWG